MKLQKTSDLVNDSSSESAVAERSSGGQTMSRRDFLRNSSLMAGGAALATGGSA